MHGAEGSKLLRMVARIILDLPRTRSVISDKDSESKLLLFRIQGKGVWFHCVCYWPQAQAFWTQRSLVSCIVRKMSCRRKCSNSWRKRVSHLWTIPSSWPMIFGILVSSKIYLSLWMTSNVLICRWYSLCYPSRGIGRRSSLGVCCNGPLRYFGRHLCIKYVYF